MIKSPKKKTWIIMAEIAAAIAVLLVFLGLFIKFYHEIYNIPVNDGGVMDVAGYDLETHHMDANLYGEWEFFYNKWIITDGYDGEPDAMLNMPGYWTDKKNSEGVRFGKNAYVSYRMVVVNLKPGTEIMLNMDGAPAAYRAFINGELCTVSGTLSKDPKEVFTKVNAQEVYNITVPENGRAEIVLELAATHDGGLPMTLSIRTVRENRSKDFFSNFAYIVLGTMLAVIAFDIILNLGFSRKRKQFSSILLLFSVFLHFLTSREICINAGFYPWAIDYALMLNLNYITGLIILVVFTAHLILSKQLSLGRKSLIIGAAAVVVCVTAFYLLTGYSWRLLPALASIAIFGYLFWRLAQNAAKDVKFSGTNIALLFFLMAMLIAEIYDNLGFVFFVMETATSIIFLLFTIVLWIQTFLRIRDSANAEVRTLQLEREINSIKQEAYKAQVNPHFIFNVLSGIEDIYKKDLKRGEEALEQFAAHLRQHIDSGNRDLIPFESELKNVMNYIELENLRREKPLEVLFDIEFQDFEVPVLSLQPLVENAIRYSGITKKKGGFLSVSSERLDGIIRISIRDNGNGFDSDNIRENGTGLKNTAERFKLLLNADMKIDSRINEGTNIAIDIPAPSAMPPKNTQFA